MIIGVPKEIKTHEYRVGMVPQCVKELISLGHAVVVQHGAGAGANISDGDYIRAGAKIVATAEEVFAAAELIIKVKEPQVSEYPLLNNRHILFTFLHLAAEPVLALDLIRTGVTGIAYETVTDAAGHLPLLAPMSAIAGRLVVQSGAHYLEKPQGGRGILLGGIVGATPAQVTVLGGGVVGTNAIQVALGMGAKVTVVDKSKIRLRQLSEQFGTALNVVEARSPESIEAYVIGADLLIGAVLVPGASAPKLVSRATIDKMQPGTVVADVAIDQGGCFESSRATNFDAPTYMDNQVIHQCITNLPSAVPRTAAFALNNATMPYIILLAQKGYKQACKQDPGLLAGLNICNGVVTHEYVAKAINQPYVPASEILGA